jgi:hypothetical protein
VRSSGRWLAAPTGTVAVFACLAGLAVGSTGVAPESGAGLQSEARVSAAQTDDSFSSVSCVTRRDCMAVGAINNPTGEEAMLAEHWNGNRWSAQRLPSPPKLTVAQLAGVSCPSRRTCVAVGGYFNASRHGVGIGFHAWGSGLAAAERWDGRRWSIEHPANPGGWRRDGGGVTTLNAVSCPSARDCIAVGSYFGPTYPDAGTLIEHWNGKNWSVQKTSTSTQFNGSLSAVSCPSTTSCMAVGSAGRRGLAERWNGTRWARVRVPERPHARLAALAAVDCASTTSCVAAGGFTTHRVIPGTPVSQSGLAERWNGKNWTARKVRALAALGFDTGSVSCASTHACMAVGPAATAELNGSRWSEQTPHPTGLMGVSCLSRRACTAVGAASQGTLAERWNGTRWSREQTLNPGL